MPKYIHQFISAAEDVTFQADIVLLLRNQFTVAADLCVLGKPNITIIDAFEQAERNPSLTVSLEEIKQSITIGTGCSLDSSQLPAFPNTLVKLTCVKTPYGPLGKISIGNNVVLQGTSICSYRLISIGDDVIFGPGCVIMDSGGHALTNRGNEFELRDLEIAPVHIKSNVWVGYGVVILPGVTIGESAVIGAGSVVTQNIPAHCVAAGNPCKVIKYL